jgi:hypothetical protein
MRAVEDTGPQGATTSQALATAQSLGRCCVQLLESAGELSLDLDQDPEPNQQTRDEADIEGRASSDPDGTHHDREQEHQHEAEEPLSRSRPAHPMFDPTARSESPRGGSETLTLACKTAEWPPTHARQIYLEVEPMGRGKHLTGAMDSQTEILTHEEVLADPVRDGPQGFGDRRLSARAGAPGTGGGNERRRRA